jgi:NADH:ubiquinone oxidoreductase subunit 3 (subunit A)
VFSVGPPRYPAAKRYNRAKLDAYECGIERPPRSAAGGGGFP